jgi:preprotein translocase subunit SecD
MRRSYLLIFICLIFGVLLNLPANLHIFGRTFTRPGINLPLLGRSFQRDLNFHLGLDLQGGTHLVYEADTSGIAQADQAQAVLATKNNIEKRINLLGVSEAQTQVSNTAGNYRVIIELPGVGDVTQAINTIGQTARLEFMLPKVATPSSQADFVSTGLSGKDLKIAQVNFGGGGQVSGSPVVGLEFNSEGAQKFAQITSENIGLPLAIFLDNQLLTAPYIESAIPDGKAVISGQFTLDEAKRLTIQLNAGALPVPIKIVEQRSVGATLGTESIAKSLFAGLVGFAIILIFMIANYGFKGLLADFALVIYVLLSLSFFKLVPVTLTLAGIAGFILSIGMAVDANILIFERIKEEIRWGRPKKAAIELGFHRAWTSVRDSNASSLITASILFWFGTGSIRGFALTLAIGILVSLFTSITITRTLIRGFSGKTA